VPETDKAKVSSKENTEHDRSELLVWHEPFDWKTSKGKTVHTKGHWEISPGLSESRKKEALKLKEAKGLPAGRRKGEPKPKKAKAPKPEKEPEGASPELVKLAQEKAAEAGKA